MINLYSGSPQEILRPAKTGFIVFTLVMALLINLLPWAGWGLWVRPDFVALVLLYWCIDQPRKIGFSVAWVLGLLMDVADGSLFGQHALAYTIVAYAGIVLHRRVQRLPVVHRVRVEYSAPGSRLDEVGQRNAHRDRNLL